MNKDLKKVMHNHITEIWSMIKLYIDFPCDENYDKCLKEADKMWQELADLTKDK